MATPFILIDGSSFLFRAWHALPELSNQEGLPTGAIYGVVNMLRKLLADYPPHHIAMVFDSKGKTTRHKLYPEYKANRPEMPEELACQIEPLHQIIEAMGLPLIRTPGIEADDIIGTLAVRATEQGLETLIVTGDKDMAQLVNAQVTLINTMSDTTMDTAGVQEKFGVAPEQIIDYLALMGDSVDNIPGVPKVGPKTAAKWLNQYGSLESIMENADQITGKVGENLRNCLEQLPLAKQLTTIDCQLEMSEQPNTLLLKEADQETLQDWYQKLGFTRWLKEVETAEPEKETAYELVLTQTALDIWIEKIKQAEVFAIDTETTSLNYMQAEIVGVSLSVTPGEAAYIPVAHEYLDAPEQLSRENVFNQLKPILEDPKHKKVGQNLKYDMSVLANHGITLCGIVFDTMLESYVFNSTKTRHNMDALAKNYLQKTVIAYEDVAGKGKKQKTFGEIDLESACNYAAEDADITLQLHEHLWPKLQKLAEQKKVFEKIDMPLVPVLSRIERQGVLVDADLLNNQSQALAKRLDELEKEAHTLAGETFNLSSPKQLQTIFFEKMDLPMLAKTPKGQPSTAENVLQELAQDFELPKIILEYRSLSKLKSTYTDRLPECIDPKTGRVHTSYHQAVAATGRLSSSEPNLQNIPVRTEQGRLIRRAFIAPPGYRLVAADYSQIELRIMAHFSKDPGLIDAFAKGLDIHKATAAEVFGVELDEVSSEQRRQAKAINFGLIYGMSAFGLAKQIETDRNTAQEYIDCYFARYPGVKQFMEDIRQQAEEKGYVETLFGRRLYLPDINARNMMRRRAAERTAINAPMQGTAADIIKRAMITIDDWLCNSDTPCRMIMQVHDELVFEIAEDAVDTCVPIIEKHLSQAADLAVELVVETGISDNWDEAH